MNSKERMPKIISMFRILPSIMAGTSINIKQTITMIDKVSKGPISLCLISAIIQLNLSIIYQFPKIIRNLLDSHKQKRLFDLAQL